MPFKSNNPGCPCCESVPLECLIQTPGQLADIDNWDQVSGTWSEVSGVITGEDNGAIILTSAEASNAQLFTCSLKANAADQEVDFLVGSDATGNADFTIRIVFGDSGVADDCGSVQLLRNGVALEAVQSIYGLVEGSYITFAVCVDAALKRMWLRLGNPQLGNTSAIPIANPSGRIGIKIVNGQSSTMDFKLFTWQQIWADGETCTTCNICGTGIGGSFFYDRSTCLATVGAAFFVGPNRAGVASVDYHSIISAADRRQGYGLETDGVAYLSDADNTVMTVYCDDWSAKLHITPRQSGTCPGFSTTYYVNFYVELFKNGALQSTSATGCCANNFSGLELFDFSLDLIFCNGTVKAIGGVIIGIFSSTQSVSVSGSPGGTTSDHGASITRGGVSGLEVTRCLQCTQCELCNESPAESPVANAWSLEIEGTPSDYDGTYVISTMDSSCETIGTGGGIDWRVIVQRHGLYVGGYPQPPFGNKDYYVEGESALPVLNCNSVSGKVVNISGGLSFTVVITTVQEGSGAQNEIQNISFGGPTVQPTGGTFTITKGFNTSAAIAYDADAATVQAKLEAMPSIGSGNVSVTGSSGNWDVEFVGSLALQDIVPMSGASSLTYILTGTATVTAV